MRGKVSRAVFTGLLAGCMAVTPVGTAYAESIPAEISVETTAEESAETEDVSESMEAEAEVETPEAEEPEVVVESEQPQQKTRKQLPLRLDIKIRCRGSSHAFMRTS